MAFVAFWFDALTVVKLSLSVEKSQRRGSWIPNCVNAARYATTKKYFNLSNESSCESFRVGPFLTAQDKLVFIFCSADIRAEHTVHSSQVAQKTGISRVTDMSFKISSVKRETQHNETNRSQRESGLHRSKVQLRARQMKYWPETLKSRLLWILLICVYLVPSPAPSLTIFHHLHLSPVDALEGATRCRRLIRSLILCHYAYEPPLLLSLVQQLTNWAGIS